MKILALLVALLALVGSAMAWDITDTMQYTNVKSGYQQGGADTVLNQIVGTSSGAYVKEPNDAYGQVWGQVDNKLLSTYVNREAFNPKESATKADFYTTLTQGGSATMATSAMDSVSTTPEISGTATAYQNMQVTGQFSQASSSFDSRAIIGMSDIPAADASSLYTPEDTKHFAVTEIVPGNVADVDAVTHGAGMFNQANMGESVSADISQDWAGTGWSTPTYSGGIDMWANFNGACDPNCANPIISTVYGKAATSIFPANAEDLQENIGGPGWTYGDAYYWGNQANGNFGTSGNFATNPVINPSVV